MHRGGYLNETIYGQVHATTTINGYMRWMNIYIHVPVFSPCVSCPARSAFLIRAPRSILRGSSAAVCGTSCQKKSMFRVRSSTIGIVFIYVYMWVCSILCTPCKYAYIYTRRPSAKMPTCKKSAQAVRTPSVVYNIECAPAAAAAYRCSPRWIIIIWCAAPHHSLPLAGLRNLVQLKWWHSIVFFNERETMHPSCSSHISMSKLIIFLWKLSRHIRT